MTLTVKQKQILAFIQSYINEHHYSPSYREIMTHFSLASVGTVYKYICILRRKGALNNESLGSRSLKPIQNDLSHSYEIQIPLIGKISMGYPIKMSIESKMISVPSYMVPNPEKTYLLKAIGDSFLEEFISDEDLLLVEGRQEAEAGEMIIALINQHDTLLKRYYPEENYIRLEGKSHQPLMVNSNNIVIQGVVIGLLRSFSII